MARDRSALLDLIEALKTAALDDRVREATRFPYPALVEAELTSVLGAAPCSSSADRAGAQHRTLASRSRRVTGRAGPT